MSTRLRRPAIWRPLALTVALIGFQGYLAFSAIGGQFGTENQKRMLADIEVLEAKSSSLQAEIDAYRHRVALFDPGRLDPDIVTERARSLLNMSHPDDIVVMVNPASGEPLSGSASELPSGQLTSIIAGESGL
jgi:cell division protein FtsB